MQYLTEDSWITFFPLPVPLTLEELWLFRPDKPDTITLYGRTHNVPRRVRHYSDFEGTYRYGGKHHTLEKIPNVLVPLKEYVDNLGYGKFTGPIVVNFYQDGNDYIAAHSDNEKGLLPDSPVIGVSLGATRTFRIRSKDPDNIPLLLHEHNKKYKDYPLTDRSVFVMGGKMQKECTHEIPRELKIKEPRINITFRQQE